MEKPVVSVIVPAYNAQDCIEKAIRSVLAQTLVNLEIIVVDDCSTDSTVKVIADLALEDSRVKFFQNPQNGGPGQARNIGIKESKGEWIALLDSDDWYEPARLEKMILAANTLDLNIAADNQKFMVQGSNLPKHLLTENDKVDVRPLSIEEYFEGDKISRGSRNLGLFKPIIRRRLLEENGIKYNEWKKITLGEDFYFLLECLKYETALAYVSIPYYNYHIEGTVSVTNRLNLDSYIEWKKMNDRYSTLFNDKSDKHLLNLMDQRGRNIDDHIEFIKIIEPLKRAEYLKFIRLVLLSPKQVCKMLAGEIKKDPSAILLLIRYFFAAIKQRALKPFRKNQSKGNHSP